MDIDTAIKSRISIRSYKDKKIPLYKIGKILEAAIYAPSSGNIQNWVFIVVTDDKKRNELSIAALKQNWMNEAPVHIVVCNNKEKVEKFYGKRGEELYSIQNCALAIENILLTATSLDLGSCFVGAFDPKAVSRILKLPPELIPEAIITIGYPNEKPKSTSIDPLELVTYFEEYGFKKKNLDFDFFPLAKQKEKISKSLGKTTNKILKKF